MSSRRARTRGEAGSPTHFDVVRALTSVEWPLGLRYPERLVLLTLWAHADFTGGVSYPSVRRIAECTRLSERRVYDAITELRAAGAVTWQSRPGRVHLYTVDFDFVLSLVANDPVWTRTPERRAGVQSEKSDPTPAPGSPPPAPDAPPPLHLATITPAPRAPELSSNRDKDEQRCKTGSAVALALAAATPSPTQTPEKIANKIAAGTARLGGDLAREGRNIAERFLKQGSAMATWHELKALADKAGVERSALGVDFDAMFAAAPGKATGTRPPGEATT